MARNALLAVGFLIAWGSVAEAGQASASAGQGQATPPPDDSVAAEDVVVVTASRYEERLINAPATMTVITEEAINNAPAQSVTDLIRLVPGVNLVQTSARDVNISMRAATGTLENSTLVLFDGRSIYQDFFGFVMWDFAPVEATQIKQIELIRGPASAVWGANALTGVVNVITKSPREIAGTSVSVQFGHFDRTRRGADYDGGGLFLLNATHAQAPTERFAFKLSGSLLAQESFLRPIGSVADTGEPYPPFQNRGTTQPKLDARADYTGGDRRSRLVLAGGIAGSEGIIHTGLGPMHVLRGSTFKYGDVTFERDRLRLKGFVNSLDGEGVFLLQQGVDHQPIAPTFETQIYDVAFSNLHVVGQRHLVSYGGNYRHNRFDLSLAPLGRYRNEVGAYVQDEIFLVERVRAIVGARIDRFDLGEIDKTVVSPRVTLVLRPRPDHTARLSFNRAFRVPSFFNSFLNLTFLGQVQLNAGNEFTFPSEANGNLELEEEGLTAYEAAYGARLGRVTVGAAAYLNQTDGMILFTQVGSYTSANQPPGWPLPPVVLDALVAAGRGLPSSYTYLNFNRVTDRGVELSADARLSPTTSSFVNYTWQDRSRPDGFSENELNAPSRHRVNAGISFSRDRFFGSLSASFHDSAYWQDVLDSRYHGWTEPFTVFNAGVGVRSSERDMTVAVRVRNLLNRTTQEHVFGDLIKRTVTGEVRFTF